MYMGEKTVGEKFWGKTYMVEESVGEKSAGWKMLQRFLELKLVPKCSSRSFSSAKSTELETVWMETRYSIEQEQVRVINPVFFQGLKKTLPPIEKMWPDPKTHVLCKKSMAPRKGGFSGYSIWDELGKVCATHLAFLIGTRKNWGAAWEALSFQNRLKHGGPQLILHSCVK